MRTAIGACAALAWVLVSLLPAEAGFLLTFTGEAGKPPARLSVDRHALRVEEGEEVLIYRRDKGLLWALNARERSYTEVTPEGAARMGEAVEEAMKQLREQLKDLPPEERRRVEGMAGRAAGAQAEPSPATYRRTAAGVRVGRWTCDRYETRIGGQPEEEVCFARAASLGLGPEEAKTLEAFFAFLGEIAERVGSPVMGGRFKGSSAEPPGVPIESVPAAQGGPSGRTALTGVEPRAFPASLFEVPAGFKKEEMDGR